MTAVYTTEPILELTGIVKQFPGVKALNSVNLRLYPGEIHALMGENGAGKSTLTKVISGAYIPDAGVIRMENRVMKIRSPLDSMRAGIRVITQEMNLAPKMTVMDNVFLNSPLRSKWIFLDRKRLYTEAKAHLARFGIDLDPFREVGHLSTSHKQIIEIAKALTDESKVLIMDEPTSALTDAETAVLMRVIRQLKEKNVAILYISHRIKEVLEIADRITVLRDGTVVHSASVRDEPLNEQQLTEKMVGRKIEVSLRETSAGRSQSGEKVVSARNVTIMDRTTKKNIIENCSIDLYKGRITGLYGLVGAGCQELGKALFGAIRITSGEIEYEGRPVALNSPAKAVRHSFGYVTADRKRNGILAKMTAIENMLTAQRTRLPLLAQPKAAEELKIVQELMELLDVRPRDPHRLLGFFSGGNQQKVLIARWLAVGSGILILDEPTRGVDVGAKQEIYRILNRLTKEGKSILVISTEMNEIFQICDEVYVMYEGKITGHYMREQFSEQLINASSHGLAGSGGATK